jgi:hypothetical protein
LHPSSERSQARNEDEAGRKFISPEDGDDIFLRKIRGLLLDYNAHYSEGIS